MPLRAPGGSPPLGNGRPALARPLRCAQIREEPATKRPVTCPAISPRSPGMTDRLDLANAIAAAGIERKAAETIASTIFDAIRENVATKADLQQAESALRTDMAGMQAELKADIAAVHAGLKADIAALRAELKADIAAVHTELKADIAAVRAELKADVAAVHTELRET